jgi:hypothetical protein
VLGYTNYTFAGGMEYPLAPIAPDEAFWDCFHQGFAIDLGVSASGPEFTLYYGAGPRHRLAP